MLRKRPDVPAVRRERAARDAPAQAAEPLSPAEARALIRAASPRPRACRHRPGPRGDPDPAWQGRQDAHGRQRPQLVRDHPTLAGPPPSARDALTGAAHRRCSARWADGRCSIAASARCCPATRRGRESTSACIRTGCATPTPVSWPPGSRCGSSGSAPETSIADPLGGIGRRTTPPKGPAIHNRTTRM